MNPESSSSAQKKEHIKIGEPVPDTISTRTVRRRIVRACEGCRRIKVRCDGIQPTCARCNDLKIECTWLQTKDRAALSRQYVQELEARLLHTETIINHLAPHIPEWQLGQSENASALLFPSQPPITSANKLHFPTSVFSGQVCALPGVEEVEYPSRDLADALIEAYFSRFHFLLPVVDKPSFLRQYRLLMDSTRDPHAVGVDTAFVALTFAVFAIAVRFVDDPRLITEKADEGGMGTIYYERTLVLQDISHTSTQLTHVQTFTLMAAFVCSINRLPQAWLLIGQGIRTAQDLGLHRSPRDLHISAIEKETRRKIWWGVCTLDRMFALTLGQLPGIEDSECDVELPVDVEDEDLPQYFGGARITDGSPSLMAGFIALIKLYKSASHMARRAYPLEAWKEFMPYEASGFQQTIEAFSQELAQWAEDLPIIFKSGSTNEQHVSLGTVLYSNYSCVLATLHRNVLPRKQGQSKIPKSVAKALSSARECIRFAPAMKNVTLSMHSTIYLQNFFNSAVIILLYAVHAQGLMTSTTAMMEAVSCLEVIESWEGTWPGAKQRKELLLDLVKVARAAITIVSYSGTAGGDIPDQAEYTGVSGVGQSTGVWELASMGLPIGSLQILTRYLTNPPFRVEKADEVEEPLYEGKRNQLFGPRAPVSQTHHVAPLTGDRRTPTRSSFTSAASREVSPDSPRSVSPVTRGASRLSHLPSPARGKSSVTRGPFLALLFTILEYPPFNEVIHWDGTKRVVLEQPQILESYILMPVFGLSTLDVFKRRLYALGFDYVPHQTSGQGAHPEILAWEHVKMTRLNPPLGFTSRDWSEEIETDDTILGVISKLSGGMLKEEPQPYGSIPDGSKTLAWYGESETLAQTSVYSNSIVHREKELAAIRLGTMPKVRETASKVAEDLQRRYDLLFVHLETPKPLRLTAAVRWGVSNLKIPAHAWKSPVPTQVIEDYLADAPDDPPASSVPKDWVQVVNKFVSRCGHLYEEVAEPESRRSSRHGSPRVPRSRASSPRSEGHVELEDDGPSRKELYRDD